MKIVINTEYGGFSLSEQAVKDYLEIKEIGSNIVATESPFLGSEFYDLNGEYISQYAIPRQDPVLVQVVEALGEKSWGWSANLKVVEIPDNVEFYIHEYDGIECIHEVHRTWN